MESAQTTVRTNTKRPSSPSGAPLPQGAPEPAEDGPPQRAGRRYQYWFALPSIVLVAIFFFLPFIANGIFAFTSWSGYSNYITFNGLNNFIVTVQLGVLAHAVQVTVVYAVLSMVVQNVVSIILAKAMQAGSRADSVFRSIYFVPVLISPLAAGYIWAAVLAPHGPLNAFISLFVPGTFGYAWLGHDATALGAVAFVDGWKWSGLVTLIYIAGLNRIPRSILEAARVDGAGPQRRFWSVEFPLLAPAFTFNVVITLVGAFSALDSVFSMTAGGPGDATSVLNVAVYNQYGQGQFGLASSLSFVITIMVILTAVPLIGWLRRREVQM